MKIAIYKTMLKSTGRVVYVGQTKRIELVGKSYFGSGILKLFNNAKYRREHFVSEIITITEDQNEANDLERYYIDYYCTLEEYGGFNIAHDGLGSVGSGEKNPFYGKQHTEEYKQKMSKNSNIAKKCVYNNIEFGSKKEAYNYAKDYCGYEYGYTKFCNQFKG